MTTPFRRPDLVLIDGGAGQLAVACEVFADLGVQDICVIGVAKGPDRDAGREHFHHAGRDAVHARAARPRALLSSSACATRRTALPSAPTGRSARRTIGTNPLDEIAGIGPPRKRALLKHFGSAKAVSRAGVEDLKAVDGISAEMAQTDLQSFSRARRLKRTAQKTRGDRKNPASRDQIGPLR